MFFKFNPNGVWTIVFDTQVRSQGVFGAPKHLDLNAQDYAVMTDQREYDYLYFRAPAPLKKGEPVLLRFAPGVFLNPARVILDTDNMLRPVISKLDITEIDRYNRGQGR